MTKKTILISVITFLFFILSCSEGQTPIHDEFTALGTFCTIDILSGGSKATAKKAQDIVREVETLLSTNIASSQISKINSQAGINPVRISQDVYKLLEFFLSCSREFDGLLNPAILPVTKLWGIGTASPHIPTPEELQKALAISDASQIELADSAVFLPKAGMGLDIGSIGKGWAAELVAQYLKSKGVKSAIISLGGNIALVGNKKDGTDWNIGVRDPFGADGDYGCIVSVKGGSAVTSGIYERFFEKDGKRYHHIIDPRTGYPADNELAGVTIFTGDSTRADAYSTGVFLLGLEKGMEFIENTPGTEALFITKDKKVYFSSGLEGRVRLTSKALSFGS